MQLTVACFVEMLAQCPELIPRFVDNFVGKSVYNLVDGNVDNFARKNGKRSFLIGNPDKLSVIRMETPWRASQSGRRDRKRLAYGEVLLWSEGEDNPVAHVTDTYSIRSLWRRPTICPTAQIEPAVLGEPACFWCL